MRALPMLPVIATLALLLAGPASAAPSTSLVIGQVYGGGGNVNGAVYTHDYVTLFNRGPAAVTTAGWSLQYASAAGTTWTVVPISGLTVAPGAYALVQLATAGPTGQALSKADLVGAPVVNLSNSAGKVVLSSSSTACAGADCAGPSRVDFVGYGLTASASEGTGPAPAPSNALMVQRREGGCQDTDDNAADFQAVDPVAASLPWSSLTQPVTSCAGQPVPTSGGTPIQTPTQTPVPTTTTGGPTTTSGGASQGCVVPRLRGLRLGTATARLRAAGCTLGRVTRPKSRRGTFVVLSQTRAAGRSLAAGSRVGVTLGHKPKPKRRRR